MNQPERPVWPVYDPRAVYSEEGGQREVLVHGIGRYERLLLPQVVHTVVPHSLLVRLDELELEDEASLLHVVVTPELDVDIATR